MFMFSCEHLLRFWFVKKVHEVLTLLFKVTKAIWAHYNAMYDRFSNIISHKNQIRDRNIETRLPHKGL